MQFQSSHSASVSPPHSLSYVEIDVLFAIKFIYLLHYLGNAQNDLSYIWTVDRLKQLENVLCVNRLLDFTYVINMWLTELMTGAGNKWWQFPKRAHHKCWHGDWQRQLGSIKFSAVLDKIEESKSAFLADEQEKADYRKGFRDGFISRIYNVFFLLCITIFQSP